MDTQESSWLDSLRHQLSRVYTATATNTTKTVAANTDIDTCNERFVPQLITRLWVKGIGKPSATVTPTVRETDTTTDTSQHVAEDVTERTTVAFDTSSPIAGLPSDTSSGTPTSGTTTGTPMRCVHLTYSRQTLLEAMHDVPPSAKLSNIRALDQYQRTGKEPA